MMWHKLTHKSCQAQKCNQKMNNINSSNNNNNIIKIKFTVALKQVIIRIEEMKVQSNKNFIRNRCSNLLNKILRKDH